MAHLTPSILAQLPKVAIHNVNELIFTLKVYLIAILYCISEIYYDHFVWRKRTREDERTASENRRRLRTVVMTGADGTIGREVLKQLLESDAKCRVIVIGKRKPVVNEVNEDRTEFVKCDLADLGQVGWIF